jgi:L-threonylcarbamoyladenylate synthase
VKAINNIEIKDSYSSKNAIKTLKNGGVVLIPTDTVIGLCCLPIFENAIDKIFKLKGRDRNQNLPIMVSKAHQLQELGLSLNASAIKLLESDHMPGPLTLILGFDKKKTRPQWLMTRDEIGVRMPNDTRLLQIIDNVGPILMTSANKHGSSVIHNDEQTILAELDGIPDLIIPGKRQHSSASTIVNVRFDQWAIEREGGISKIEIDQILSN